MQKQPVENSTIETTAREAALYEAGATSGALKANAAAAQHMRSLAAALDTGDFQGQLSNLERVSVWLNEHCESMMAPRNTEAFALAAALSGAILALKGRHEATVANVLQTATALETAAQQARDAFAAQVAEVGQTKAGGASRLTSRTARFLQAVAHLTEAYKREGKRVNPG